MKTKRAMVMAAVLMAAATVGAQPTGQAIMESVYNRPTGNDIQSDLTMTLINSRGDTRERQIRRFIKEYGVDEKKVMFFLSPADVRDTSFLSWSYGEAGRDDDQWIYLPALKRIKRISSSSQNDYFMGSDFTYDDLGERHPSEDNHRLLREETVDGEPCYVVESVPKDDESIYTRTVTWVVKDTWVGKKKEFYDEDGDLLKVQTVKSSDRIAGYWVLLEFEMHNVQRDHRTLISLKNVRVDEGIDDSMFTERMMTRGVR